MLQPIKIIIIIAACTLLPVINESRSFAESADRKKAYKSRAREAFKSSSRRQSRSSRNDKKTVSAGHPQNQSAESQFEKQIFEAAKSFAAERRKTVESRDHP
jgi:uncharacterized membrane protein YcjF (UPF0283 family)